MDKHITTASRMLNVAMIAKLAEEAILKQAPAVQELLLQSKSEQTFSGLLAGCMQNYQPLDLGKIDDINSGSVLLEFKGENYERSTRKGIETSRNFHDISIVNQHGEFEVIIENKFWYHFDGCKGKKMPKPEKGMGKQIKGDIFKIRQTFKGMTFGKKGFILLNVVTPGNLSSFPKSYQGDHDKVFARTTGNLERYRADGIAGINSVIDTFSSSLKDIFHRSTTALIQGGFIDFICAEINLEV
jgi:hypothetical protein